jgi:hypothetical protein
VEHSWSIILRPQQLKVARKLKNNLPNKIRKKKSSSLYAWKDNLKTLMNN